MLSQPTVAVDRAPHLNRVLHKLHQAFRRRVQDAAHADSPDPRPVFLSGDDDQRLALGLASVRGSATDLVEALRRGSDSFLGMACEAEVRQIVLTDAHSVLGWQKWREIEGRYGLGRIKLALQASAATGRIREEMVDVYAHILLASLIEVAFLTARDAGTARPADGVARHLPRSFAGRQ